MRMIIYQRSSVEIDRRWIHCDQHNDFFNDCELFFFQQNRVIQKMIVTRSEIDEDILGRSKLLSSFSFALLVSPTDQ